MHTLREQLPFPLIFVACQTIDNTDGRVDGGAQEGGVMGSVEHLEVIYG